MCAHISPKITCVLPVTKNLSQVITSATLQLCQIRYTYVHGVLLGTWVKYNQHYFYLYPFLKNSPTSQTCLRIFMYDSSNDEDTHKDVPFGIRSHGSPFRELNPSNSHFWDVNRRFQTKRAISKMCIVYYQNYYIDSNQILHSD